MVSDDMAAHTNGVWFLDGGQALMGGMGVWYEVWFPPCWAALDNRVSSEIACIDQIIMD